MDTKLNHLLIFSIIIILGMISCQVPETCYSFTCDKLDNPLCSVKNSTTTSFALQKCSTGQFCPWNKEDNTDSCKSNPKLQHYPGGYCTSSDDCLGGRNCVSNVCAGVGLNETCTTYDECLIGLTCLTVNNTKTCQKQLGLGMKCDTDYDCQNRFGCFSGNCTPYFSLLDDTESKVNEMCQSGFSLNGKCKTLSNVNSTDMPCTTDSDCQYKDSNGTAVTIQGSCKCGYNKNSTKYCDLGSANTYYKNMVAAATSLLNYTDKCHTLERGNICVELASEKAYAFRKTAQNFKNNYVYAKNYPRLVNSETCVKYTTFSEYDDTPVTPDKYQCAKFTCTKEGPNCFASKNPFNEDGSGVAANLTKDICQKNETCYLGPNGVSGIYDSETVNGKCVAKTDNPLKVLRYPGEDCSKSEDCFSDPTLNGTCSNNVCVGKALNEQCTSNEQCVLGTYCNGTMCLNQVAEGKACEKTWDCQNNLGCYNKTCTAFGTLKTGADVSSTTLGDFAKDPNKALFCEFGFVSMKDGSVCAKWDYINNNSTPNSDGLIKCNWNDKCNYTDGSVNFTQTCGCGYNAEGQGYCPLSQSYNEKYWKNSVLSNVKTVKNKCHSLNRFSCYKPVDADLQGDLKTNEHKTLTYHLYYNAVDCALDVLAGSSIQYSIIALFTLLAFLF